MPICDICKQFFSNQTLESFFSLTSTCHVCKVILTTPVIKEEYPLNHNVLITLSHQQNSHVALDKQVFESIFMRHFDCLWVLGNETITPIEIRHLIKLLRPFMIYKSNYIDYDFIENVIENDEF